MNKNSGRLARVNDLLLMETAEIIRSELKDPRIGHIISVLKAQTSPDLKYCKMYVSILGDAKEQQDTFNGLLNASGFIRKRLAERINLRSTPELRFIIDKSMEYGFMMDKLIDEANKPSEGKPLPQSVTDSGLNKNDPSNGVN